MQWVGRTGAHGELLRLTSCSEWRESLRSGAYELVVVGTRRGEAARWTATDPAAAELITTPARVLYRFDPEVPDPGCPDSR